VSLHLLVSDEAGQHEMTVDCPCRPQVTEGVRVDGTYGTTVEHRHQVQQGLPVQRDRRIEE
jgi:hypothetical protein